MLSRRRETLDDPALASCIGRGPPGRHDPAVRGRRDGDRHNPAVRGRLPFFVTLFGIRVEEEQRNATKQMLQECQNLQCVL